MTSTTSTSTLDVAAVRANFPSLTNGAAHFDGPGGTQTPARVAQRMYDVLTAPLANRGMGNQAERNAEACVVEGRSAMADMLGVESHGIIFGRSMTQNTMDMARAIAKIWGPGDEVIVTRLDHDSNIRPWVIAAEARGATVRWLDFDPETSELDLDQLAQLLNNNTKLVAVTAASNLIGTMPPIATISEMAHDAGALSYVDGVHYAAHAFVDVPALKADFFGCSPYKFLGPHCGTLYGRPELLEQIAPDKLRPSTNVVPERFELGTLPYEMMAGTAAAVDFIANIASDPNAPRRERLRQSMHAIEEHEDRLRHRIEDVLAALPSATVHSRAARRTPTLLVTFEGHDCTKISAFLAERGVNAPSHSFYAYEAALHMGLGEAGGLRIGLAPYNDDSDVDRLESALTEYLS